MTRPLLLPLVVLFGLATACSADVGEVFGSPSDEGGGNEGASSQGGSTGEGNGGPTGSGASPDTGQTTPATTDATTDVTNGTNETVTTDDTTTTGRPPPPAVDCDGGPCPVDQGGVCCFDLAQQSSTCLDSAKACETGFLTDNVAIACQTPDDCGGGQICCARREYLSGQAPYDRTECADTCEYPDLYLCDINAPECPVYDTDQGPFQSICQQSQLLPGGYFICGFN